MDLRSNTSALDVKMRYALFATILASGMTFLDGSIINLALPDIANDLNAGLGAKQWIVVGYLVSLSSVILIGGSLGDIYGRKRIYLLGVIGFGLSSLACSVSVGVTMLVAARFIQGIFGALIVPGSLAIINSNFEKKNRSWAIGIWTASTAAVTIFGPFLGGFIVDASSWRMVFVLNIPLVLLTLFFGIAGIHETQSTDRKNRLDYIGALVAIVCSGSLSAGLIELGSKVSPISLGLIALGVLLVPIFILWERHHASPIVDVTLFRVRNFSVSNIMTFFFYGALSGFMFILAQQLIDVSGYSALGAGAATIPISVMLMSLSSRIGVLSAKYGARLFMVSGPLICALAMVILINVGKDTNYLTQILPGVVLFGIGLALLVTPLTSTVMASLDDSYSGLASGVNNALSRVSGSLVVAVIGIFSVSKVYKGTVLLCVILAVIAGVSSIFIKSQESG